MSAIAQGDTGSPIPAQPGLIRSLNNRVVLELLIEHGSLSRSDVHTMTGLSKPTASQLLSRLEEAGLVRQGGLGKTGPGGRAPQLYRIEPTAGHAAAVDVRRDRIHVRLTDITGAVVAEQQTRITDVSDGPATAATAIHACCDEAEIAADLLDAIVVGLPGSYDADSDALWYVDQVAGWNGPSIGAATRKHFPSAAVAIENDVNLAAIAEQHAAGSPTEDFFLFWLDEGVGGAMVINGALHRGSRGAAGEVAFLYTPGVTEDTLSREHGAFDRYLKAASNNPSELAHHYALALASVIALLDPARLVLGGELARMGGEQLRSQVAEELAKLVLTAPPLTLAVAVDSPVLDGATRMSLEMARDRVFTT